MTSWSDLQLKELSLRSNHKVVPDTAGEYRWMHKIDNEWSIHSIKVFEDEDQAYSWMYFWVAKWDAELMDRQTRTARGKQRKLRALRKNTRKTTTQKIQELRTLMAEYTVQDIANEFGVSRSTVDRAIKLMTF
tara:strand:- start:76 stop:474 length:399 start_codon:yes stop_codon:yes gene_type:complete